MFYIDSKTKFSMVLKPQLHNDNLYNTLNHFNCSFNYTSITILNNSK